MFTVKYRSSSALARGGFTANSTKMDEKDRDNMNLKKHLSFMLIAVCTRGFASLIGKPATERLWVLEAKVVSDKSQR